MSDLTPDEWQILDQWRRNIDETPDDAVLPGLAPRTRARRGRPAQVVYSDYGQVFLEPFPDPGERIGFRAHPKQWAESQARAWAEQLFTAAEARAWLTAGLHTDEQDVAALLRDEGVHPDHLGTVIRRQTVLERLRIQRLSVRQIADLLRREGLLVA